MARSFKEIERKAEKLIEQGEKTDKNVQSCMAVVAAAQRLVGAAGRQLAAASATDENGKPKGDVSGARIQLSIAQGQLAASQRTLAAAQSEAEHIRSQKAAQVEAMDEHNRTERDNIEKLRQLSSYAFEAHAVKLARSIAERLNEIEDAKVKLLRSMGIEAEPEYVSTEPEYAGSEAYGSDSGFSGWNGGGNYPVQNGGGNASEGSLTGVNDPSYSVNMCVAKLIQYSDRLFRLLRNPESSADARNKAIAEFKYALENLRRLKDWDSMQSNEETAYKTLKKTPQKQRDEGNRYIENIMNVYREELERRGIPCGTIMDKALVGFESQYKQLLENDCANGTFNLYLHPEPDFDKLTEQIKSTYLNAAEQELKSKYGVTTVRLDGFDCRFAQEIVDSFRDTKKDFPDLHTEYFGSIQEQRTLIKDSLTDLFTDIIEEYRSPQWTDEQVNDLIERNVRLYYSDRLKLDESIERTYGWSLFSSEFINANLKYYYKGKLPEYFQVGKRYDGVGINLEYAGNYEKFKSKRKRDVEAKYKPLGCELPKATIDHEFGHEISRLIGAGRDPVISKWYEEMRRDGNAETVLSGYSAENIEEFIAEGYSEYRNNPHPRPLATKIYNRLIELYNNQERKAL